MAYQIVLFLVFYTQENQHLEKDSQRQGHERRNKQREGKSLLPMPKIFSIITFPKNGLAATQFQTLPSLLL